MNANNCTAKSVLVVNIGKNSESEFLHICCDPLFEKLKSHPALHVEFIDTMSLLQSKCIEYNPKTTVLMFIGELVTENNILFHIVQNFVIGGALAIFSSMFAHPDQQINLFTSFGLPWKERADTIEQTFVISPIGRFILNDCKERFSAKANMLTNVLPQQMLYTMDMAQRNLLLSEEGNVSSSSSTIAAFAKVGKGAVSYIGTHIPKEDVFIRIIVSLCTAN